MRHLAIILISVCLVGCGQTSAETGRAGNERGKAEALPVTLLADYGPAVSIPKLCAKELPCREDLKSCQLIQSPRAQRQLLAMVPALGTDGQRDTERFLVHYEATKDTSRGKCELHLREVTGVQRAEVQLYR